MSPTHPAPEYTRSVLCGTYTDTTGGLVFLNEKVHKNISCHKNFLKANQFFDTTCVYKILWPTQDVLQIFIIMNKFITSELQIKVTANKNLFQYCT